MSADTSNNDSVSAAASGAADDDMITRLQVLTERDKTALGRKLHDELSGYLLAASMDVAYLKKRVAANDADTVHKFERIGKMLNAAIDMTRRVTEELHPTLLDNVGLFAALGWLVKSLGERTKIATSQHFPPVEPRLSAAALIILFRVGQEAMALAERQAGVTTLDFVTSIDAGMLSMEVSADGDSTAMMDGDRECIELGLIRQRVRSLGGEVELIRRARGGMQLTMQVRLPDAVPAQG